MAFDFPSSPTVGQEYSPLAGTTYTWNGVGWTLAQSTVPAPGFPVQIARVDVSSPVASVVFTSGIDATYDEYELHFYNVEFAVNGTLWLQVSQDGGATWVQGAADYSYQYVYAPNPGSSAAFVAASDAAIALGAHNAGATYGVAGVIRFFTPANTTKLKTFLYETSSITSLYGGQKGSAHIQSSISFNALRFYTGGNINTGSFVLYGIKK